MKRIKKKIKLKEKYNKPFKIDGAYYDFRLYNEERLMRLFDNNPNLRHIFEEDIDAELKDIGIETNEDFEKVVKEVVKSVRKKKK